MLKRLSWQEDLVLSVKLADEFFTLAQMRVGSCMQFYDVRGVDGQWQGVDLSKVPSLFCIKVAENRLKPLFVEKVDASRVQPDSRPMPTRMIDYQLSGDGEPHADLIELDAKQRYSNVGARIIKSGLTTKRDLDVIRTHELVGMLGDPEKLRKRLLRYFETGVNWDDAKAFIFKGLGPAAGSAATHPIDGRTHAAAKPMPRAVALEALVAPDLLKVGNAALLRKIRPLMADLIAEIRALPKNATQEQKLQAFKQTLEHINRYESQIETVERESILEAIYSIGASVGLDPDSQFAERWRGDW